MTIRTWFRIWVSMIEVFAEFAFGIIKFVFFTLLKIAIISIALNLLLKYPISYLMGYASLEEFLFKELGAIALMLLAKLLLTLER